MPNFEPTAKNSGFHAMKSCTCKSVAIPAGLREAFYINALAAKLPIASCFGNQWLALWSAKRWRTEEVCEKRCSQRRNPEPEQNARPLNYNGLESGVFRSRAALDATKEG